MTASNKLAIATIVEKIRIRKIVSCYPSRRTKVVFTVGSFWKIIIYNANFLLSQITTGSTIITISSRLISLNM